MVVGLLGFSGHTAAGAPTTFATFNTGTITGGGAAFTRSLDVSGLPASTEYLFVRVTADFVASAAPNNAYSSTMQMELNNGGSTVYWAASSADYGAFGTSDSTTLRWVGVLTKASYQSGGNLTVKFQDIYTDSSGPYSSQLNNVTVTIYPASTPSTTFATFNTGTITGGGAAFTRSLDVSDCRPARSTCLCASPPTSWRAPRRTMPIRARCRWS